MKKVTFTLLLAFLSISAFSQKVVIKSGDLNDLKGQSEVEIEFTYEDTKVGKMTEEAYIAKRKGDSDDGEKWEAAWEADKVTQFKPGFILLFNKYSDYVKIVEDGSAKYVMVVNTTFIEPGFNIGVKAKPSIINTDICIVEKENRDYKIVEIETINGKGMATPDTGSRIKGAYTKTGKTLGKYFTKKMK